MNINDIDHRVLELYQNDPIVHAGIVAALENNMSEVETLTMLVLTLANANKAMIDAVVKWHNRTPSQMVFSQ